jgi:hypothetical protein
MPCSASPHNNACPQRRGQLPGASEVGCGSTDLWAGSPAGSWPSLRKAFTRHGLGMLTRNPEAVRQRAIAAARHRSGQPAPPATPALDPMFVTLNRGQLPAPRGLQPEQGVRLRRAEEIETLSYRTVVALNQESRLAPAGASPPSPGAPNAPRRLAGDRTGRAERRQAERAAWTGHSSRAHHQPEERGMLIDAPSSTTHSYRGRRIAHRSFISGFSTRAYSRRIAPATWTNDVHLETAMNRSAPMPCGPNVDQAGRRRPNGLRSDARIGVPLY